MGRLRVFVPRDRLRVVALAALLGITVAACGTASTPAPVTGAFAGKSRDANLFVAIVAGTLKESGERGILAYACDGEQVSQWFKGSVAGNSVELSADSGAKLRATVSAGSVNGTLALADGRTVDFEINPAQQPAGLYRYEGEVEGAAPALGGWIVLSSGEQKGLASSGGGLLRTGTLNTTTLTVTIGGSSIVVVGITDPDQI